jgi:hypothetical protein
MRFDSGSIGQQWSEICVPRRREGTVLATRARPLGHSRSWCLRHRAARAQRAHLKAHPLGGTAVWVTPVSETARAQYDAMVASGELPHQQAWSVRVSEWGNRSDPTP